MCTIVHLIHPEARIHPVKIATVVLVSEKGMQERLTGLK